MKDYCKTCRHNDGDIGFCDKCYYNHIIEEKGIPPTEYEAKPKPITNADRIRAMSDEELAEWLAEVLFHCSNTICDERCPMYKCCCDQPSDNILDWLKEEATDGKDN